MVGRDGHPQPCGYGHVPLADLFNAVVDAGLRIRRVAEPRDDPVPWVLALVAEPEPPSRRPV